jgi:hypothetical protein
MVKTAMSELEDQVELIRREAYAAGYAATMLAIREIAARPAPAEKRPTPAAPTPRGRSPATAGSAQGAGPPDTRRQQARCETPRTRVECEARRGTTASARAAGGPPGRDPRRPTARQGRGHWPTRRSPMRWDSWKLAKLLSRTGTADGGSHWRQLPDDRGAPVQEIDGKRRSGAD